jgi:hypothetical protein
MIGGGGLAQSYNRWDDDNDWQDDGDHHFAEDRFFVVQPTAHAELNVTHWMRLRGTVGYRWTSGISKDYSDGDFSGLVAGGGVIFGGF